MEKIRVLRIIARLNIGGPAIQTILLTNALNNDEFESLLVTGVVEKGEGQMDFLIERYHVKSVLIPELGRNIRPIRDIMTLFKVYGVIKQFKPHIVHTHTSKAGFMGRVASMLAGVPVKIHTFHGHTFFGYFNPLASRFFLKIERILALFTDRIIAVSPLQFEEIVDKYKVTKREKCIVIPLGIDLDAFLKIDPTAKIKKEIGFNDDDMVIGTVGRMTDIKNHRLFLSIASLMYDSIRTPKLRFAIIGNGELKRDIIRYRDELGLTDIVRIFDWQSDIAKFYRAFDIFLLTSRNEGTPVSCIEAMASGLPVVSTAVGGVPDVVKNGQTGYVIKSFDPAAFTNTISMLMHDKDARFALGMEGRKFVKDAFSKERLIKDIKSLYHEILKEKGVKIK